MPPDPVGQRGALSAPASSGRRLAQISGRDLGRDEHPRTPAVLILLAPLSEAAADVLRVDLERVADVLEGEEPGAIFRADPLARLVVHLAPAWIPGVRVLLVTVDGILEDGQHEKALALESAFAPERRE